MGIVVPELLNRVSEIFGLRIKSRSGIYPETETIIQSFPYVAVTWNSGGNPHKSDLRQRKFTESSLVLKVTHF